MSTENGGNGSPGGGPAEPLVGGKGIKRVGPGSEVRAVPEGFLGLNAVSRATVGRRGSL